MRTKQLLTKMLLVALCLIGGSDFAWAYDVPSGYAVKNVFIGTDNGDGTVTVNDIESEASVPSGWTYDLNSLTIQEVTEVPKQDINVSIDTYPTYVGGKTIRAYLRKGTSEGWKYATYTMSETVSTGKLVFNADFFASGHTSGGRMTLQFLDEEDNLILTLTPYNYSTSSQGNFGYAIGDDEVSSIGSSNALWGSYFGYGIQDLVIDLETGETSLTLDFTERGKVNNYTTWHRAQKNFNLNIGTGKNIAKFRIGKASVSSKDIYFYIDNISLYSIGTYSDLYNSAKAEYNTKVESLDAAGQAYWTANVTDVATITTQSALDAAVAALPTTYLGAVKAQTTALSDMTDALLTEVDASSWTGANGTYGGVAAERYNGNTTPYSTGKILYQTVSGLHAGYYQVKFYGVANVARNLTSEYYGSGIAQMYANDETQDVDVIYQEACSPISDTYLRTFTVYLSEDNSSIEFGIKNIATGGQWYVAQALSLTYLGTSSLEIDKAALDNEIVAATTVKNSWTPKVGTTPFKYNSTYYDALVTELGEAATVAASGSTTASDYTTAKSELEAAKEAMASSTLILPAADKYYRLYLADNGVSTGKNINMLKCGSGNTTITTTPYPVKFVASGDNYIIENPYDYYIVTPKGNTSAWGAYKDLVEGETMEVSANVWSVIPQEDGTFKMLSEQASWKGWNWYLGTHSTDEGAMVSPYDNTYPSGQREATKTNWLCSEPVELTNVTLSVNATAGWGTFIAPYDNLKPETVKAYTVANKDNGRVYFEESEEDVLSANTPYILSTEEAENVSVALKGIATNGETATYTMNGLVGLMTAGSVPVGSYVMQYQNSNTAFYKVTDSPMTGTAYRCYLDLDNVPAKTSGARQVISFNVYGDDDTTGISQMENGKLRIGESVYNLNGQRIDGSWMNSGIYIHNGRKVVVK